jgi:hypothetical protein
MYKYLRICAVAIIVLISFSQLSAQSSPSLVYPANAGSIYEVTPLLQWTYPVGGGSVTYNVQVATANSFTNPYIILNQNVNLAAYGYGYLVVPSALLPGTYYWRVGVGGYWSAVYSFTILGGYYNSYFTITASSGPNGYITPSGATNVISGGYAAFSMIANPGYVVDNVLVDGSPVGAVSFYAFSNVTANHTISVSFAPDSNYYQITATAGYGGTITPSGTVNVLMGNNQSFTISAWPYYSITDVVVDSVSVGAVSSYSFNNVTANHTISASFTYSPARTYYVDDSNPLPGDGSYGNPFQNLQTAIDSSFASDVDGNTIYVFPGSYNYFVNVIDSNLTITGSGIATVRRFLVSANNVSISNFYLTNSTSVGTGIIAQNVNNLSLSNIYANNNTAWGGYFININGLTISNSTFSNNGSDSSSPNFYGGLFLKNVTNPNISNVTANNNIRDGFAFALVNNGIFENLTARLNTRYGLAFDESNNNTFNNGNFSRNLLDGIHIHPHYEADLDMTDSIKGLSFTGTVAADSNARYGMVLMTDITSPSPMPVSATNTTYIYQPSFDGSFSLKNNASGGMWLVGNVESPSFKGFKFYGDGTNFGALITGWGTIAAGYDSPTGVVINNSTFQGFTGGGTPASDYAISLADSTNNREGENNVDARQNIFIGANISQINTMIFDSLDVNTLGLVDVTGWNNGSPAVTFGNVSSYTGSTISIPVNFTTGSPVSYLTLEGKITYDSTKVQFNSIDIGTGTIININGWGFAYSVAPSGGTNKTITFSAAGLTPITSTCLFFKLNFTIVAPSAGSTTISGLSADWKANTIPNVFIMINGNVSYTVPVVPSTVRGDANMDYNVTISDANTVLSHLSTPFLSGQALTNADANLDASITTTDISYILYYVANGTWPIYLPNIVSSGDLAVDNVNYKSNGILEIPINIKNAQNVNNVEVLLSYDPKKIDYQSFSQEMKKTGVIVNASEIKPGTAKFVFASASDVEGNINPGKLVMKFANGSPEQGTKIQTFYKISGDIYKPGPVVSFNSTSVESEQTELPTKFDLSQNYPNPFNPTTTIRYSLPKASYVSIKIYNMLGQEVKTLFNGERNAGAFMVQWNGDNNSGQKVASGAYIYRIVAGSFVETKKMMFLK